jgi:ABC-type uncharacterized transport system fused permease/ATPase subunit
MNYDDVLERHFSTVTPSPNFEPDLLQISTMEVSLESQETSEFRLLLEVDKEMQGLTKRFKQQVRERYLTIGAVVISSIVTVNIASPAFFDVKVSFTDIAEAISMIADLSPALWLLLPLFTTLITVTIDRRGLKELP